MAAGNEAGARASPLRLPVGDLVFDRLCLAGDVRVAAGVAILAGLAALMAALGLTNLIIVLYFSFATWAWFVSVSAVAAKVAACALQYAVFRSIVRRRFAQSPG